MGIGCMLPPGASQGWTVHNNDNGGGAMRAESYRVPLVLSQALCSELDLHYFSMSRATVTIFILLMR